MTLAELSNLTGLNIPKRDYKRYNAQIARTQKILETLLGFTLDQGSVDTNYYEELGKLATLGCPCPTVVVDEDSLNDPDEVVYAYRMFAYNRRDKYIKLDPFTEINAVKLVKNGVTYKTFDTSEYRIHIENGGLSKYLEICESCGCNIECENCVQLAVDADWLWDEDATIPEDLLGVWADMVVYYSNQNRDIKSETMGPHSYTKFDRGIIELQEINRSILLRYAGSNGTITHTLTA